MSAASTLAAVVIAAVVGPLLLSGLNNRHRKDERAQDWKRQDEVAARLAAAQQATTARTEEVAAAVAESSAATDGKLDQIHTLVNSQLSTALRNELAALVALAALMADVIEIKRAGGLEPTEEALAALELTKARAAELELVLEERNGETS